LRTQGHTHSIRIKIIHNHNDEPMFTPDGVHAVEPYLASWRPVLERHPELLMYRCGLEDSQLSKTVLCLNVGVFLEPSSQIQLDVVRGHINQAARAECSLQMLHRPLIGLMSFSCPDRRLRVVLHEGV